MLKQSPLFSLALNGVSPTVLGEEDLPITFTGHTMSSNSD